MNLVVNTVCNFCNKTNVSICHLYWECEETQLFWNNLEKWLNIYFLNEIKFTKIMVWFGTLSNNRLLNHIIFSVKRHIHMCDIKSISPSLKAFKNILKDIFSVENYVETKDGKLNRLKHKWFPLLPLLST